MQSNEKEISGVISAYKKQLTEKVDTDIMFDPVLFWGNKLSAQAMIMSRRSKMKMGDNSMDRGLKILGEIAQEYDKAVFERSR